MKVKNRFPELMAAVRETVDQDRLRRLADEGVDEQLEIMQRWLGQLSPHTTEETFVSTGHDHEPIAKSYGRKPNEFREDGVTGTITNASQHFLAQARGASPAVIPRNAPYVKFWIGAPLRWPIRSDAIRKRLARMGVDGAYFVFGSVNHPGFKPWRDPGGGSGENWIEQSSDQAFPQMLGIFRSVAREATFEPLSEFFRS